MLRRDDGEELTPALAPFGEGAAAGGGELEKAEDSACCTPGGQAGEAETAAAGAGGYC